MTLRRVSLVLAAVLAAAISRARAVDKTQDSLFSFAFSGDSRNCGDVVMPAIAAGVNKNGAAFYWHLGDFRKMYRIDEDITEQNQYAGHPPSLADYYNDIAWPDFLKHQLSAFSVRIYLAPGNHEFTFPAVKYPEDMTPAAGIRRKERKQYMDAFKDRLPKGVDHPYYHWRLKNVDFISLDNATDDQFDEEQTGWFTKTLDKDLADDSIAAVVVGMHEALPGSISSSHSMDQSDPAGRANGKLVYDRLLEAQKRGKRVYVLASHSHFLLDGDFNNHEPEDRLRGFIVGTAGAVRYKLPAEAAKATTAKTGVYGYMLATVGPKGEIDFQFREIKEDQVPPETAGLFSAGFVHQCFAANAEK